MRRRRLGTALGAATALLLAACAGGTGGGVPTRPPDTTGVLEGGALVDSADDYYEGMSVLTEDVLVVDQAGALIAAAELVDGQAVEVWIGDSCAESYPVQCTIVALRVAAAPD